MRALLIIVNIIILSFAIVAPWATMAAFKSSGRLAGWTMTWVTLIAHAYAWFMLGQNPEILFFFGPLFWGVRIYLHFCPIGAGRGGGD